MGCVFHAGMTDDPDFCSCESRRITFEQRYGNMADIQVGDKVEVVKDDSWTQTGKYVGRVGTVETLPETGSSCTRVSFGDGTGEHGDFQNGTWWCDEVKKVDANGKEFSKGDRVSVYDSERPYVIVYAEGGDAWVRSEVDTRFIVSTRNIKLFADVTFEVDKTYVPEWNKDAQFVVKDIFTNGVGAKIAVGFYSYDSDDRNAKRDHVDSYPLDAFEGWAEV